MQDVPRTNGTLTNAILKLLQGYHQGRGTSHDTCYNWVGWFLRVNPVYDNTDALIRFWGLQREPLDRSLIVHGDAIVAAQERLLISDAPATDYAKMQLVVSYRWEELKAYYRIA